MSQQEHVIKVALKYCGCCNPQVDLNKIACHLAQLSQFQLVPLSADEIDIIVILCGCPRTCGNKENVKARARRNVVTAGESINGQPVSEKDLAAYLEEKLATVISEL